jgi:hypothetical protein
LVLGGQPARYEKPQIRQMVFFGGSASARYNVFAIHEGRPIILAFDYWLLHRNRLGADSWALAQEIVDSFKYLDPVEARAKVTYTFESAGFALDVPADVWRPNGDRSAYVAYLTRWTRLTAYPMHVDVRRGDGSGQVIMCEEPAGPWERCGIAHASSLRQLEAAVAIQPVSDHGVGPPSSKRAETILDGERAILIEIKAYEYPARGSQTLAYIIAMHDGRPWVIRLWSGTDSLGGAVDEVLDGFRFLD